MPSSTIRYKRTRIRLSFNPRTGVCRIPASLMHKHQKKQRTEMHHWRHDYETREVKKDPNLALANTAELCYQGHRFANVLRQFVEMPLEVVLGLIETMDPLTKQFFMLRCRELVNPI